LESYSLCQKILLILELEAIILNLT
jgi:hypothetical protein